MNKPTIDELITEAKRLIATRNDNHTRKHMRYSVFAMDNLPALVEEVQRQATDLTELKSDIKSAREYLSLAMTDKENTQRHIRDAYKLLESEADNDSK